jgi:hypothetical protein
MKTTRSPSHAYSLSEWQKITLSSFNELAFFSPNSSASPTNPNIANYETSIDLNALLRTKMFGASPSTLVGVSLLQIRTLSDTVSVRVTSNIHGRGEVVLADGGGMFHLNHNGGSELVNVYLEHDKATTLADFPDETTVPKYDGPKAVANLNILTSFSDARVNTPSGLPTLTVMNEQQETNTFIAIPRTELLQDISSYRTMHSGARIENPSLLPRAYFEVLPNTALFNLIVAHQYALSLKHGEVALLSRRSGGGSGLSKLSSLSYGSASILISDEARITLVQRVIEPLVQFHAKHAIACDKGEPLPKIVVSAVSSSPISVRVDFNVWMRDDLRRDALSANVANSSTLGSDAATTKPPRGSDSFGGIDNNGGKGQRGSCMLQ